MNKEEQKGAFEQLVSISSKILLEKGDDYSGTEDRLSNFKDAGKICGITPQQHCLALIATKVARLGNLFNNNQIPRNEPVMDSMIDLFNYAALLYMIHTEKESAYKDGKK